MGIVVLVGHSRLHLQIGSHGKSSQEALLRTPEGKGTQDCAKHRSECEALETVCKVDNERGTENGPPPQSESFWPLSKQRVVETWELTAVRAQGIRGLCRET